jgi:hypothetical protein
VHDEHLRAELLQDNEHSVEGNSAQISEKAMLPSKKGERIARATAGPCLVYLSI